MNKVTQMNKTMPTNRKYILGAAAVVSIATLAILAVPANAEDTALLDILHDIFTNTENLSDDLDELKTTVHEIKETLPTINTFNQGIVGYVNDEGKSVMTLQCGKDAVVELFHIHSHGKDAFQRMEVQYWTGSEIRTKTIHTDQSVTLDIPVLRNSTHTNTIFTIEPYVIAGGHGTHGDSHTEHETADTVRFHPIILYSTNGIGTCHMVGDIECYTDHATPGGAVSTCPDSEHYDPAYAKPSN